MGLLLSIAEKMTGENHYHLASLDARQANEVIGRKVTRLITRHFQEYSTAHPNKLGGKRTHFVSEFGDGTAYTADASGVKVVISHVGARLRIEGGEIMPTGGKKYLTIPAVSAAYGKLAGEFNNLRLLFRRKNGKAEAYALGVAPYTPVGKGAPKGGRQKARGKNTGEVMFWLVRSANIPANRALLPTDDEITTAATQALSDFLKAKGGSNVAAT